VAKADLSKAKELYPSCNMGVDEWATFFGTPPGLQAMGRVIYDIYDELLSVEERNAGVRRIGRRPARPAVPLSEVFDMLFPQEWTNEPFPQALSRLLSGRSHRQFAGKVPMSPSHLSRVLSGEREVNLEMIENIARALGVNPWFFSEWRAQYLGQLITEVLTESPHLGITILKGLRRERGKSSLSAPPPTS